MDKYGQNGSHPQEIGRQVGAVPVHDPDALQSRLDGIFVCLFCSDLFNLSFINHLLLRIAKPAGVFFLDSS